MSIELINKNYLKAVLETVNPISPVIDIKGTRGELQDNRALVASAWGGITAALFDEMPRLPPPIFRAVVEIVPELIENGVRACEDGQTDPHLLLKASLEDSRLNISVDDDGIGMQRSTDEVFRDTNHALGFIATDILPHYNATIAIQSSETLKGTRVHIIFPLPQG